ncbi:MAG TPA: N-acyl homoserine lactonase family protein [Vicinamibacterales bacterium]|nr:N-acyl homoserine lactonase family protein [Vicinamibacterales bacterium]
MGRAGRAGRTIALFAAALVAASVIARADVDKYEVYAVRFATLANFPVSSLVAGADRSRRMDIAMMIWVLKGADGRIALVDSGFHREQYFRQFTVKDYVRPPDALAPLGITAGQVTDIFLSHMHWDHAGGLDLFPAARIWVQKDEYDYYTGEAWQAARTHGGIDPDDVLEIVKRNTQGKVSFVRGDNDTLLPGVLFGVGGRHTWASQFVSVQTRAHTVVLASDNMYLYENLDAHLPVAQTLDAASNLRTQDRMRSIASEPRFLVPGHDPAVFDRFPHVADRIVRIE